MGLFGSSQKNAVPQQASPARTAQGGDRETGVQGRPAALREVGPVAIPEMPEFTVRIQAKKAAPQTEAQKEAYQWAEALYWEAREEKAKHDQMADAVEEMKKAAQMGSAEAMVYMGLFSIVGLVVEKDEDKGWDYIRQAERLGYLPVKPQKLELDSYTTMWVSQYRTHLKLRNRDLAEYEPTEPAFPASPRLRNYELAARQRARDFLCPAGGTAPTEQEIKQRFAALEKEHNAARKKLGGLFGKNSKERIWECALEMAWLYWLAGLNGLLPQGVDKKLMMERMRDYSLDSVCWELAPAGERRMEEIWLTRLLAVDDAQKIKQLYDDFLARELGANEAEAKAAYERRIQEAYQKMIGQMEAVLQQNQKKKEAEEEEKKAEEARRKAAEAARKEKLLQEEHEREVEKYRRYEAEKAKLWENWVSERQKKDAQYSQHVQPYVEYLNTLFVLYVRQNFPGLRPSVKKERTSSSPDDPQIWEYWWTFRNAAAKKASGIGREFLSLRTPEGLRFQADAPTREQAEEREKLLRKGKEALGGNRLAEAADCISRILPLENGEALYQLGLSLSEAAEKIEEKLHDDYAAVFREWCTLWAWDSHMTAVKKGCCRSCRVLLDVVFALVERSARWSELMTVPVSMPDGSEKEVSGKQIALEISCAMFARSRTQDPDELIDWGQRYESNALLAREYVVRGVLAKRGIPEGAVTGIELAERELFPEADSATKALYRRGYRLDIEGKDFRTAALCYKEAAARGFLPAAWMLAGLGHVLGMNRETVEYWEKQAEPLLQDKTLLAAMAIQGDFRALEKVARDADDTRAYALCEYELSFRDPEMRSEDLRKVQRRLEETSEEDTRRCGTLDGMKEVLSKKTALFNDWSRRLKEAGVSTALIESQINALNRKIRMKIADQQRRDREIELEIQREEWEEQRLREQQAAQEMSAYREKLDSWERAFNSVGGYYGTDTEAWTAGSISDDDYFLREQFRKEKEEKKQRELDSIYHRN